MPVPNHCGGRLDARSKMLCIVLAGLFVLLGPPVSAQDPQVVPAPVTQPEPMSARQLLIEYATLRGIIDRCTRSPNQVDFPGLIEAVVATEGAGLLDRLSGRTLRLRGELQAGVNMAYMRALPSGDCASATELLVHAGRADALAAGLKTVLARRR